MADDLASQLAGVMVKAANLAAGNHSTWPIGAVQAEIAADLRRIMETTSLPEWYAGYEAGCREQAAAQDNTAPRLYAIPGRCAVCGHFRENHKEGPRCICGCRFYREPVVQLVPEGYDEDDYACSDYTPDERHRHTIGGQTWEHAHEGGHEAHSAVSHDLGGARLMCMARFDVEQCERGSGHDGYHDSGTRTWADAGTATEAAKVAPATGDVLERSTCRHCHLPVVLLHVQGVLGRENSGIWNHEVDGTTGRNRYAPCSELGWINAGRRREPYIAAGGTWAEPITEEARPEIDLLQALHELAEDLDNGHPPDDAAETVRWAANVLEGRR